MINTWARRTDVARSQDQDVNLGKLTQLLQLAGPELGAELLARLAEDLQSVLTGLSKAVRELDGAQFRAQSHVLIALSGTIGDVQLQTLAESMNRFGRTDSAEPLQDLLDTATPLLQSLIVKVQTMQARGAKP